jgi:hypothetical protein
MKKVLVLCVALLSMSAFADEITIRNMVYGSGTQEAKVESTQAQETYPGSGLYHSSDYMPGYPTASPIFPRVVDVPCTKGDKGITCDGFNWSPSMGRGEYLLLRPLIPKEVPVVAVVPPPPPEEDLPIGE